MPSIRELKGRNVTGSDGKYAGQVAGVLFHPSEPRVVGIAVEPPAVALVVSRPHRYVTLDLVASMKEGVTVSVVKLPKKASGVDWDKTVFWLGMPVRTVAGERLGVVNDAVFSAKTGELRSLTLSGGTAADAALGRAKLDPSLIEGFDGEAVVVTRAPVRDERGGGAARGAATGVAVAKVRGGKALEQAGEMSRDALRRAGATPAARKAYGVLKGWARQAREAMSDDEDED